MPIRTSPPYQGFCDMCNWTYDGYTFGDVAHHIQLHEQGTGHDAAKSYRESTTQVATPSSYEYRARNTRSGRVVSDSHGVDWYTEEGSTGLSSERAGREIK